MITNPEVRKAVSRNQSQQCKVQGCRHNRRYLSGYCSHHSYRACNWGSGTALALHPKEYRYHKALVTDLLEKNKDHTGVQQAIQFFENWMRQASMELQVAGSYELSRMHYTLVTGLDCLIESAAVWCFYWWDHTGRWDTGQPLTYMLGHRVMSLAPQEVLGDYVDSNGKKRTRKKTFKGTTRRAVGKRIRDNLGILFMNIMKTLEKNEEEEKAMKSQLREPLIT